MEGVGSDIGDGRKPASTIERLCRRSYVVEQNEISPDLTQFQAADAASRQVFMAAAREVWCV
jgi:hypothetical protein